VTTPPEPPKEKQEDGGAPVGERVTRIEAEQERQGGLLDKILGKLSGTGDDRKAEPVTQGTDPAAGPADMTEQMRQAVRDVQAEDDADAGRAARLGKRPEPETTPREVTLRGKDKLQKFLFGAADK
jgi:hypothetical protein